MDLKGLIVSPARKKKPERSAGRGARQWPSGHTVQAFSVHTC